MKLDHATLDRTLTRTTIQTNPQTAPVTVWARGNYTIDPVARTRALDALYKLENWAVVVGSEIQDEPGF